MRTGAKGLASTNLLQDRDGIAGHGYRIQRLVLQYGIEDFVLIVSTEWGLAKQHLISQDTKRPPIDCSAVSLFEQDLVAYTINTRAEFKQG
jgi:hypothetical protein